MIGVIVRLMKIVGVVLPGRPAAMPQAVMLEHIRANVPQEVVRVLMKKPPLVLPVLLVMGKVAALVKLAQEKHVLK